MIFAIKSPPLVIARTGFEKVPCKRISSDQFRRPQNRLRRRSPSADKTRSNIKPLQIEIPGSQGGLSSFADQRIPHPHYRDFGHSRTRGRFKQVPACPQANIKPATRLTLRARITHPLLSQACQLGLFDATMLVIGRHRRFRKIHKSLGGATGSYPSIDPGNLDFSGLLRWGGAFIWAELAAHAARSGRSVCLPARNLSPGRSRKTCPEDSCSEFSA